MKTSARVVQIVASLLARHRYAARVALGFAMVLLLSACFGPDRQTCSRNSECEASVCTGNGFCESECAKSEDCPCNAYCAESCGMCLLRDGTGPATCFGLHRLVSTEAALSACMMSPPPAVNESLMCEARVPACDGGASSPGSGVLLDAGSPSDTGLDASSSDLPVAGSGVTAVGGMDASQEDGESRP